VLATFAEGGSGTGARGPDRSKRAKCVSVTQRLLAAFSKEMKGIETLTFTLSVVKVSSPSSYGANVGLNGQVAPDPWWPRHGEAHCVV
jgi:hypothetical protein